MRLFIECSCVRLLLTEEPPGPDGRARPRRLWWCLAFPGLRAHSAYSFAPSPTTARRLPTEELSETGGFVGSGCRPRPRVAGRRWLKSRLRLSSRQAPGDRPVWSLKA